MDVHLNPDLEAQVKQWVADTGRTADELVEDAIEGYFAELAQVRETLNRRYEQVKKGEVRLLDGEEALARLRRKSEDRRANRS